MSRLIPITVFALLGLGACTQSDRATRDRESDSHAYEAGRKAREAADKAEKAIDEAGKKVEKAAKDAERGWKDKEREDRAKGDRP